MYPPEEPPLDPSMMMPPPDAGPLPPVAEADPSMDTSMMMPQGDTLAPEPAEEPPPPEPIYDTEEARILSILIDDYLQQEQGPRDLNMKEWRKHLNYWEGLQYTAWDAGSQSWKTPEQILDEDPQSDIDPSLYAKVVNIYKAHGEILIGALSSGVPTVRFFPLDADDHEDIQAAKSRSKLSELIQRHNRAKLLMMKALYLLYNCGMVSCYNENKTDFRFGSYQTPIIEDIPIINQSSYCPQCGAEMAPPTQLPQGQPPAPPQAAQCQSCGYQGPPEQDNQPGSIPMQTGELDNPRNREVLEIYGPLNVRIPLYVKEINATPYICLEEEFPVALLREIYPEFADKIQSSNLGTYDSDLRIPSVYKGDIPDEMCTVQRVWFQPWALNLYQRDKELIQGLKQQFSKGLYVVRINDNLIVEIVADNLQDHWTLAENPFSETLHAPPIGRGMVPLQDIENELDNLTLETIEFGLPELFADPKVLDFTAYQRQEIRPGQVSPANAPAGRSLGEGFHEVKATTLSREVDMFAERMNNRQQFVQGTYPSIYGGTQEGGSGTAREYELSKASALQRLSTTWTILQEWWAQVMKKSTDSFVKHMKTDENMVQAKGSNFVNVWIKQSELTGAIGEVAPEIAEPFPISWTQKRDVILNLVQMKDPMIGSVLAHPENAGLIAATIGLPELHIPGDDSRNKQLWEISQLIMAEPMPGGGMGPDGQPIFTPSIPVDPVVDDNMVEAEICKSWLRSEVGLDCKQNNPGGYMNVVSHLKMHDFFNAQQAQQQQEAENPPEEKGGDNTQKEGAVE